MKKLRWFTIPILLLMTFAASPIFAGTTGKIAGKVIDKSTGEPLIFVNILLAYNLSTSEMEYFYKSILPPYVKSFAWGSGEYIYMITGDTDAGETWTVYRVDMGITVGQ
ncbi:MAG: hypothetical protein PVH88_19945 [Ignavibacteria bacterium]|jgi:hypothetical protein